MNALAHWLFNPSGLTPHGFCLLWEPGLIWLHALSDIGIGLSYFAIPIVLSVIIRRRPDLVFRPVVTLFAAFILLCGTGHWLDVLTLWVPAYGLEGVVKALTAIVSTVTAVALWRLTPEAIRLPSPLQMRKARADLRVVRQAEARLAFIAAETAQVRDALAEELARRQATEAALRESEGRFRLLLQSNLAEALYLMDPQGRIETWNAGAQRIKGYAPDEVVGRHFSMFYTPEDVADGAPARALAIARETGHFASEGWRVRKDGTHFLAHVAIDSILHDDGTLRGFVKVTVDLTKQRIDEAQRRLIVEAAPNGLMTVDEAGIITLANTAVDRIFGYPAGGLIGQKVDIVLPGGLRGAPRPARDSLEIGDSATVARQVTGRRRDGAAVTIALKLSTVRTPRGDIVVLSLDDVTERLRLEAERLETERRERQAIEQANANLDRLARHLAKARDRAEQANRAKSNFLAGMSHELRTPLNAILGYANLLKMEGGFTPSQDARLSSMLSASRHLLEMITCVLDLSEIEAEHVALHPAEIDVQAIGEACLDLVRPAAEAKGLALSLAIEPGTPCLLVVDPTRFRQVLVNLLGNAVKFTQQGGVVLRLQNAADGAALRIEVRDTGPGISAESRARLFQDFERLDAPDKVEGAGLGLALSFRLTKLLGGTLSYEDNPGGGSVFWMELPFGQAPAEAAPAADPEAGADQADIGALRVLVVDDVQMNRDIAESFLRSAGHSVTSVEGGQQAVQAVAGADFDAVLMDVRMPDMDGLEATRRIRSLGGTRARVPVIGLTAYAYSEQVAECRAAGMDGHLAKPFEPETLYATLKRTVGAARRRDADVAAPVPAGEQTPLPSLPQMTADVYEPSFDVAMFERTRSVFTPETSVAYLRKLDSLCDGLLSDLGARRGDALYDHDLAVSAHTLAGSAGMFGFLGLASIGRQLERDVLSQSPELPAVAERFCEELLSAQREIRSRTAPAE
jgi:PAS domain S-box-containing protein